MKKNCLAVSAILCAMTVSTTSASSDLEISNVPGYFKQDLPGTDPGNFDYIKEDFGILDNGFGGPKVTPWERLRADVAALNKGAEEGTGYRVLFLARHGQGFHNVAESYYGTVAWELYWGKLDGNGTSVWADAELTEQGEQEARNANAAWKTQIEKDVPVPESFYSSPLRRSANTLKITWSDITLDKEHTPKPVVKEKLRETLGVHTCDRRSSKTVIAKMFPGFEFEEWFAEEDELWNPEVREQPAERNVRLGEALKDIFRHDKSTYITISAHSGAITSMLAAIGHRPFGLQTGGVIPVVVKVRKVYKHDQTQEVLE